MARFKPIDMSPKPGKGSVALHLPGRAAARKVDGQWKLYCLVHNIEKLATVGGFR
jgi:hypothetical protein